MPFEVCEEGGCLLGINLYKITRVPGPVHVCVPMGAEGGIHKDVVEHLALGREKGCEEARV